MPLVGHVGNSAGVPPDYYGAFTGRRTNGGLTPLPMVQVPRALHQVSQSPSPGLQKFFMPPPVCSAPGLAGATALAAGKIAILS